MKIHLEFLEVHEHPVDGRVGAFAYLLEQVLKDEQVVCERFERPKEPESELGFEWLIFVRGVIVEFRS